MKDPREKRPSQEDLMDERYENWLKSVKSTMQNEAKIIDLTLYTFGKTATVLSEREIEVLQLASFGNSTDDISKKLNLSLHTVQNHRKNMLKSSRCNNITELVRVAIHENLL